jgi:hypothetical protein
MSETTMGICLIDFFLRFGDEVIVISCGRSFENRKVAVARNEIKNEFVTSARRLFSNL